MTDESLFPAENLAGKEAHAFFPPLGIKEENHEKENRNPHGQVGGQSRRGGGGRHFPRDECRAVKNDPFGGDPQRHDCRGGAGRQKGFSQRSEKTGRNFNPRAAQKERRLTP